MIEGLHLSKVELKTSSELVSYGEGEINFIGSVGEKYLVSYKLSQEEEMANSKPIYIGCMIYSYARMYMYDNILSKIDWKHMFYTDTDSCKTDKTGFDEWYETYAKDKIVPHWKEIEEIDPRYIDHKIYSPTSKVYGSFENEYKADNCVNYFIAKKNYYSGRKAGTLS